MTHSLDAKAGPERFWISFADCKEFQPLHIRQWQSTPFDGGFEYVRVPSQEAEAVAGDLHKFAREIIRDSWEGCDGGDIIQELAVKHGLIKSEPFDPKVHGTSAECEPGDTWYTFSGPLASTPTIAPVAVSVKKLIWSSEPPYSVARPFTGLHYGTEVIWPENGKSFDYVMLSGPTVGTKRFASLSDAKAAAQSDYEARIRSAIIPAKPAGVVRQVRDMFDVEYHDDGRIASVGHASDGLRKIVTILDAALQGATDGVGLPEL